MINIDCLITKNKIVKMFQNFTPEKVSETRAELQNHLLVCKECRDFLDAQFEKKQEEVNKK